MASSLLADRAGASPEVDARLVVPNAGERTYRATCSLSAVLRGKQLCS